MIDVLTDDVLVEIFLYVNINTLSQSWDIQRNTWRALVHVCRRWRSLAFASPRHLNLRFYYGARRPISEMLDVCPGLPVAIVPTGLSGCSGQRWNNILAALESEHYNRICELRISGIDHLRCWERFAATVQKPFPELTHLEVFGFRDEVPVLRDSFLGGSAPRLRELSLGGIPFPSIPKLLLSANRLVKLHLSDIPDSGYFSPDAMAAALTVMTGLEYLFLRFRSPRSLPDPASRPLHPPTRFVLPVLAMIIFRGHSEHLEVLLARIDAPRLYHFVVEFFMGLDFDVPQLHRFLRHAEVFNTINYAEALLSWRTVHLNLYHSITAAVAPDWKFELEIDCRELDRQLSSLSQVCSSFTPLISTLEVFKIREEAYLPSQSWKNIEETRWLELLDPFTGLKDLYLTSTVTEYICGALRNAPGQRATEVLPALRKLFVSTYLPLESVQETVMPFVAARQLSGHPVIVDYWAGDFA